MSNLHSLHTATLAEIQKEKQALKTQLEELEDQERTIRGWLNGHAPAAAPGRALKALDQSNRLLEFVVGELNNNETIGSKQLMAKANQEGVEYKDGRSFNAILMNLLQNGRAKRLSKGVWAKA